MTLPAESALPFHFLVIEDDPDTGLVIRIRLQRAGHTVTVHQLAEDALESMNGHAFDLITVDQGLPRMSGVEFIREAKRRGIATPIFLLSGDGCENLAAEARAA